MLDLTGFPGCITYTGPCRFDILVPNYSEGDHFLENVTDFSLEYFRQQLTLKK